jgi:uncharacterized phage protein (TIGR01671 family)
MREIEKFRGKRLDNGEWAYGGLIPGPGDECRIAWYGGFGKTTKNFPYVKEVDPATVGEYTGLTDCKGKRIFEGDIVKWGHLPQSTETPIREAIVTFNPDICFKWENPGNYKKAVLFHYGSFCYRDTYNHLEVIGTIHDEPTERAERQGQ